MRNTYYLMAFIGLVVPNYFVWLHQIETGNYLLWLDSLSTLKLATANDVASAFFTDLFICVPIFFLWSYREMKRLAIGHFWYYLVAGMLFGLAFVMPLVLMAMDKKRGS